MVDYGYAGHILRVDLSNGQIEKRPTDVYAERFIGGRGLALKIFWDEVPAGVRAYDPENYLICSTGPVAGFSGLAGSRWQISAMTAIGNGDVFSYANLGGKWGVNLKFAGYDALVMTGAAEKPVYLVITDSTVEIRDAAELWGLSTFETADRLRDEWGKSSSVLSIGPAAENLVTFATLLTDDGASGSSGLGGVMGSKKVKAVVVKGSKRPKAADTSELNRLSKHIRSMRDVHDTRVAPWVIPGKTKPYMCFLCGIGCSRQIYKDESGKEFKSFCQAATVYMGPAQQYYKGQGLEPRLEATRMFDGSGLDTIVMDTVIGWLRACHEEGLLKEKTIGLPLAQIGSREFIKALVQQISSKEGFGELLAQGPIRAAEEVGGRAKELVFDFVATPRGEKKDYDPRLIPVTSLLFATEPRRPIQQLHEPADAFRLWVSWVKGEKGAFFTGEDFRRAAKKFWGSEEAADFTSYQGKALAAKKIQDRTYAKESMILCDFNWPIIWANYMGGHVGDPTLESRIFSAVTGRKKDEDGLNAIGERIFNLQRLLLLRHGWKGRQDDRLLDFLHHNPLKRGEIFYNHECLVPGKKGAAASNEGRVIDREAFEKLKTEYYELRGWDTDTGIPTKATLNYLGLNDSHGF